MTTGAGLGGAEVVAFTATTDPDRAREFYESVIGLRLIADEEFAIVFDAGGTMLRIQKAREHTPPPFTVLGWKVENLGAVLERLRTAGVEPVRYPGFGQDDAGIWTAPDGAKIAWFTDPDGNTLSLTEFTG
ncbi:MAG: VOC family protein [Gordonia sp. (in: high G+C Gram-positive bacteria)]|uniref:VOC family protein n=1 Tax=Gordonia sp. (in: high G+C Gram-positive bacteria) TaxID=84139 RepID=UPI0039E4A139